MEDDLRWCCGSSSNNWDLHAVVRFACGGGGRVTPPPASDESFSWLPLPQPQKHETIEAGAPQPADAAAVDDLCLEAALFAVTKPDTPLSASSPRNQAPPQLEPPSKPRTSYRNGGGPTRSKRKKTKCQVSKDVTRVAAGAPSPDLWAWRKYGQKPIKGSPYPRGYYRCSTDKNCKARKQVERCRDDPTTLIVSYTGEHSHPVPLHRNSLAGTTRKKPQPPPSACPGGEPPQPQAAPTDDTKRQGSPSASAGLSPATPVLCPPVGVGHEEEDEEEAVTASMRLEDVEMEGEDDVLLFLEPALGLGSCGSGCDCEDAMLFRPEPSEPAPGQGNGVGWEDVMLFSKLYEPAPTTSRS